MKEKGTATTLKRHDAQSIIEFTFAMVLIALMIFGLVRFFQWTGLLLADHRYEHERTLTVSDDPMIQLSPDYYTPRKADAVFRWGDKDGYK